MGNGLDLIVAGQANADMEDVVECLLGVNLRDEGIDGFVGDLDILGVWYDIDVVEVRGDAGGGEEGGDYFPGGIPGDFSEWLCWLMSMLNLSLAGTGRTPNPVTYTVMGLPRGFDVDGITGIVVALGSTPIGADAGDGLKESRTADTDSRIYSLQGNSRGGGLPFCGVRSVPGVG